MSKAKPLLTVEWWPIGKPAPYARNARKISKRAVDKLAASIQEFGWRQPIVVDSKAVIVAGHTRLMAAQKLDMKKVPVHVASDLTEAQIKAYRLMDNRSHDESEWDMELVEPELLDLKALDFDLALTGFEQVQIQKLLAVEDPEEDNAPPPPALPVTVTGDLWLLGGHRVLCGDSTSIDAVERLMDGKKADMVLTDPPYGIGDTDSKKNKYEGYSDTLPALIETVEGFMPIVMSLTQRIVLTPGNANARLYPDPTWTMAWFTPAGVGSGPWGFCCWQPILCYGKDPKLAHGKGRHPDAIVHTEAAEDLGHPCTKPIKFWQWLMERTSEAGDLILEPFAGSGTTFIAAEKTGRSCYGMELSPAYVDVIVTRWQQFTGQQAVLDDDGRTFDAIKASRTGKNKAA